MLKTGKTILQRSARAAISIVVAGALLLPTVPFADIVPAYADTPNTSADASASNEGTKQEAASTSAGTMDAHPLSTGASSDGTDQAMTDFSLDAQNRVSAIVPLDGSVVDSNGQVISSGGESGVVDPALMGADQLTAPKTEAEKQAILDQYLADGTITEDDLANETLIEGLTGTYSEGTIPNSAGNNVVNQIQETCGNCLSDSEQLAEEEKQREEESGRWPVYGIREGF